MNKPSQFIVVYSDDSAIQSPMTWDADCEGALCCSCANDSIALFTSRADARKSIRISTAYARLQKEQGKPHGEDFTTGLKHVHIQPCSLTP